MGARTKARMRALQLLFEADQRRVDLEDLLGERLADPGAKAALPEYAVTLVEGVARHRKHIDELLATYSHGWSVPRMPAVDRAILRLATEEVVYRDEVPDAVAINEAVVLARELSTDDSPAFVNGLLGRIAEVKHTLA